MKRFHVAQLEKLGPILCPCGEAKRAFNDLPEAPVSVHVVRIKKEAKPHYHKKLTEVYVVLEGRGYLELDGERVEVEPLSAVMILPGCVHRAFGELVVLNVVCPPFDPSDEYVLDD